MIEVRVALPAHLRTLAGVGAEVRVRVPDAPTIADALDALEAAHPALAGTVRDQGSGARRAHLRYMAAGADLTHEPPDAPLPAAVALGEEPFRIVGAISGG